MSAAPPRIIIDCELSLLSHRFSEYLPLFAAFAKAHLTEKTPKTPILRAFYKEYHYKTLTLETAINFLRKNQVALHWWLMIEDKVSTEMLDNIEELTLKKFIALKDPQLKENIIARYAKATTPIIIVTTCPYTQLITDCLTHVLPKVPFEVLYAPLPGKDKKNRLSSATNRLLPAYSVLRNKTKPPFKDDLEYYWEELQQRLLNTNFADTCENSNAGEASSSEVIAITKELVQPLPTRSHPIIEQEQKKASPETAIATKKSLLYDPTRSYSPSHWKHLQDKEERRSASPAHAKTPPRVL